jgi:protein required for attachment to host cells
VQGHSANELSDPIRHQNELFARELAAFAEKGRTDNRYEALVLIAPARFLGTLRNVLPKNADKLVTRTVPKDVVQLGADEIRRYATELP